MTISKPFSDQGQLKVKISVKWWGWFSLVYEVMTRESKMTWYKWLVYPGVCYKAIRDSVKRR